MLRLSEFTANVSAIQLSTKRLMSASSGWKSNTAPRLDSAYRRTSPTAPGWRSGSLAWLPLGKAAWPTLIEAAPPSCGKIKWQARIAYSVS